MKYLLKGTLIFCCCCQLYSCGSSSPEKTIAADEPSASAKIDATEKDKSDKTGSVSWTMNGKKWQSVDYRCSWILDKKANTSVFNFTAYWEKANTKVNLLKHLGCNVYHCLGTGSYYPIPRLISISPGDPACSLSINMHENDFNGIYNMKVTDNGGEVKIEKIDTVNHVVSGTFHGTMVGHGKKEFAISDGRFDNLTIIMVYDLDAEKKKTQEVIDKIDMKKVIGKTKEMEKNSGKQ